MERATLLLNHVLGSEPAATLRLRAHAGRCIRLQFDEWPRLLPGLPATTFRVTPAGLVECCGDDAPAEADLRISIDASNPALAAVQALAGERPRVTVSGDAALAGDVDWLFDNLRWDVADDLERWVGAAPAREITRLGRGIAAGVGAAARRFSAMASGTAPAEPAPR